jgi:ubiquitin-protein ligase E3 C
MWLYQGSISVSGSTAQLPALKLFWRAMSTTKTFYAICTDSKAALSILLSQTRRQISTLTSQEDVVRDRDWRVILLFLELYAFVLRFTDDEEFLSGSAPGLTEPRRILSRSRESALPLEDVKLLTIFLKNLSFTMYFNAAELTEDESLSNEGSPGSLGSYFGNSSSSKSFEPALSPSTAENGTKRAGENRPFLGISGMTFNYVRGIVTRVMRMLYERDSRRRFLPKDHWLMTSRFDMEGFIPAVVMEEERRHQVTEVDDEVNEYDDWALPALSGRHDLVGMHRSRRLLRLENLRRQQLKLARNKMLAAIGPRLEILQNMPFVIPFATRVQIFRQFVYEDQLRRRGGSVDPDHWRMSIVQGGASNTRDILGRHHAKISRNQIFEDAFEQFYRLGDGLKEPIQITFVDKFGATEAGIDGGGVTKEFLTSVTNEAFRSEGALDLFITNDQNLLYPNPSALDEKRELLRVSGIDETLPEWRETMIDLLRRYEFLGRIIGKCLYEGILVDIGFAGFFLLKWSSTDAAGSSSQDSRYLANINDLRDLDESLYQGLLQLKNYTGDVSDFSLDLTISDTVSMPGEPVRTITRNLLPNGSNISVTNENRVLYISGVARHRLHVQPFQQTRAFLRGLGEIINPSWLSMFNQTELQTLIGGDSSEIDVDDLRQNTLYSGVYEIGDDGIEHPTIQIFWQVMKTLDDLDRRKVLKYVTSTPRAPLLGFAQLNPRFSIRDAGSDQQRLPSTSTCINLLKLPRYESATTLRHKLLYAVNSGAGFDLS